MLHNTNVSAIRAWGMRGWGSHVRAACITRAPRPYPTGTLGSLYSLQKCPQHRSVIGATFFDMVSLSRQSDGPRVIFGLVPLLYVAPDFGDG